MGIGLIYIFSLRVHCDIAINEPIHLDREINTLVFCGHASFQYIGEEDRGKSLTNCLYPAEIPQPARLSSKHVDEATRKRQLAVKEQHEREYSKNEHRQITSSPPGRKLTRGPCME